jgi:hypothetical protein
MFASIVNARHPIWSAVSHSQEYYLYACARCCLLSSCSAIAVHARCLASSWSEKAELRRVIHEHVVLLRDLCLVGRAKRRSCTNTECTHRASLEDTRKPDVGAAGGLGAGNTCAGNMCPAETYDNPHSNRLLQFVGLCSEATTQRRQRPARLPWRCRCLYSKYCLRQTRGKPASSEQRLRVRAGSARRRRNARLGRI